MEKHTTNKTIDTKNLGLLARLSHFLLRKFKEIPPPTTFFFIGFNLILFTKRLILAEHLIQLVGFFIATTSALIVGKAVLVADALPFMRRFDGKPLAAPILFKTVVYTLFVFLVRMAEAFIQYATTAGR